MNYSNITTNEFNFIQIDNDLLSDDPQEVKDDSTYLKNILIHFHINKKTLRSEEFKRKKFMKLGRDCLKKKVLWAHRPRNRTNGEGNRCSNKYKILLSTF